MIYVLIHCYSFQPRKVCLPGVIHIAWVKQQKTDSQPEPVLTREKSVCVQLRQSRAHMHVHNWVPLYPLRELNVMLLAACLRESLSHSVFRLVLAHHQLCAHGRMHPILQTFTDRSDCMSLYSSAHQKLDTSVEFCLYTEPYAHLCLCLWTTRCAHDYTVCVLKTWSHGRTEHLWSVVFFFFLMQQIYQSDLQVSFGNLAQGFSSLHHRIPFRDTFLYSTLSWFQMALSSPSPCYCLNPHLMCLFVHSFIHSFH